jgi:pilus assembly protein CpaB
MRNYILLVVALLAGLVAFFLTKQQLQAKYAALDLQARKAKIIVAKADLTAGDVIQGSDLTVRELFVTNLGGDEFPLEEVSRIVGQKLRVSVKGGAPLRWRDFEITDIAASGGTLARTVPKTERALAVAVDAVSSVAGMIHPNDHVDIIGTFRLPVKEGDASNLDTVTLTLLQNVTVLATGQTIAATAGANDPRHQSAYSSLTLSVTPEEAEMLVFAQQKGRLVFVLRNPQDVETVLTLKNLDFNTLQQHLQDYTTKRAARTSVPVPAPRLK